MEFSEYDLHEMLEEAVDVGKIERDSAAHGIGKLYIDKGFSALTPAQMAVYTRFVDPWMREACAQRDIDDVLERNPK